MLPLPGCLPALSRKLTKPTPSGNISIACQEAPVTGPPSHLSFPSLPTCHLCKATLGLIESGCCFKSAASPGLSGGGVLVGSGESLVPRTATVLRFTPLASPPPPDSPQSPGSSLKEILCTVVGSLLGRRRAQHKGAERVNWGGGSGREGKRTDSLCLKGN